MATESIAPKTSAVSVKVAEVTNNKGGGEGGLQDVNITSTNIHVEKQKSDTTVSFSLTAPDSKTYTGDTGTGISIGSDNNVKTTFAAIDTTHGNVTIKPPTTGAGVRLEDTGGTIVLHSSSFILEDTNGGTQFLPQSVNGVKPTPEGDIIISTSGLTPDNSKGINIDAQNKIGCNFVEEEEDFVDFEFVCEPAMAVDVVEANVPFQLTRVPWDGKYKEMMLENFNCLGFVQSTTTQNKITLNFGFMTKDGVFNKVATGEYNASDMFYVSVQDLKLDPATYDGKIYCQTPYAGEDYNIHCGYANIYFTQMIKHTNLFDADKDGMLVLQNAYIEKAYDWDPTDHYHAEIATKEDIPDLGQSIGEGTYHSFSSSQGLEDAMQDCPDVNTNSTIFRPSLDPITFDLHFWGSGRFFTVMEFAGYNSGGSPANFEGDSLEIESIKGDCYFGNLNFLRDGQNVWIEKGDNIRFGTLTITQSVTLNVINSLVRINTLSMPTGLVTIMGKGSDIRIENVEMGQIQIDADCTNNIYIGNADQSTKITKDGKGLLVVAGQVL